MACYYVPAVNYCYMSIRGVSSLTENDVLSLPYARVLQINLSSFRESTILDNKM